jgi:hypothetical protein
MPRRPFHVVNYLGSLGGARVLGHARMERLMDFVIARLQRSVLAASEDSLNQGMHIPAGWDPYFNDYMTRREVYHYPTQHYDQFCCCGNLFASDGVQPYTWSVVTGALPPGLALPKGENTISGTPTTAGTFTFTIRVTDDLDAFSEKELSITIS